MNVIKEDLVRGHCQALLCQVYPLNLFFSIIGTIDHGSNYAYNNLPWMRTWPSDKQIELQKDNEDNFDSLRLSETLLQLTE